LRPGTVKIKVAWAGICGSDLGLFEHAPVPRDRPNAIMKELGPHTLGHEFSGYVTDVADDVDSIGVGELVAVQPNFADGTCAACLAGHPNLCENFAFIGVNGWGGGFSEAVVVPADHAFKMPAGFDPEFGALVEPLTVAWHAVKVSGAKPGDTALVIGAGPIGLALVLSLRLAGVSNIVVSELSESRKALAPKLGASLVLDPRESELVEAVRDSSEGAGADVSFDASGVGKATLQPALDALRPLGRAVIVASFHGDVPLDVLPLLTKEKLLTGSFAYTAEDFGETRDSLVAGQIAPGPLITSRLGLNAALDGGIRHLLGEGRSTEVKILVSPNLNGLEGAPLTAPGNRSLTPQ
jgi:threonine dehydrogenase-like Zn-dependent dehydrogenase